ncbi:hypothetical protein [Pseudonocardia sp. D17]|uniref:hypothetical protein n=1 Tax=Pseudonocardia sp. D17 TaxID=882661 RepID=UPI0030D377A1
MTVAIGIPFGPPTEHSREFEQALDALLVSFLRYNDYPTSDRLFELREDLAGLTEAAERLDQDYSDRYPLKRDERTGQSAKN